MDTVIEYYPQATNTHEKGMQLQHCELQYINSLDVFLEALI